MNLNILTEHIFCCVVHVYSRKWQLYSE